MLSPTGEGTLVEPALTLVESGDEEIVRLAALQLLARFEDPRIAPHLIALHQSSPSDVMKTRIRDVLLGRRESARAWVRAVDRGEVPAAATTVEQIRRVALFDDDMLDALVIKHWGKLQAATREEKLAEVRRLNNDLRAAGGDAVSGQAIFKKHCAGCHPLFGEGTKLGPDLTTANRQDRDFLRCVAVEGQGNIPLF